MCVSLLPYFSTFPAHHCSSLRKSYSSMSAPHNTVVTFISSCLRPDPRSPSTRSTPLHIIICVLCTTCQSSSPLFAVCNLKYLKQSTFSNSLSPSFTFIWHTFSYLESRISLPFHLHSLAVFFFHNYTLPNSVLIRQPVVELV